MNKTENTNRCDVLSRSVSIDLEVDPARVKIFALAAVAQDSDAPKIVAKNNIGMALTDLDAFCQGFDHVIGHNILRHDLPHLVAASPRFVALTEAPIDTLWLNPLAFPRNPYHHLVKHYQDGRLQTGHVNDPEFDARLVFEVLENQIEAFSELNRKSPDALTAYHFLCCRSSQSGGFDQLFAGILGSTKPEIEEARGAIQRLLDGAACSSMLASALARLDDTTFGWPTAYALS
jgi:ATP-dependent DNA helicase RecQ